MEFEMRTDLQKMSPKVIEYNYGELKEQLSKNLAKYNNLIVEEDGIKEAKADRAALNKLKETIENKRKEVKKQFLKPYENFETSVKEIVGMIQEPIQAIDEQIKVFEELKREKKRQTIKRYYLEIIGEFKELIPIEKVWNSKWLNATYRLDDIEKELKEVVLDVENSLQSIEELNTEFKEQVKDKFFQTLSIQKALQENTRLKEQARKQKELEQKQAERKKAEAELAIQRKAELEALQKEEGQKKETIQIQPSFIQPQPQPKIEPTPVQEQKKSEAQSLQSKVQEQDEEVQEIDFRVWVTKNQKKALRTFLIGNGIKYGKVN